MVHGKGPASRQTSRSAGPWKIPGSERAGDRAEEGVEAATEGGHGADDGNGDQRDHQAVLDGGGALLLVATDEHEGDELLEHGISPFGGICEWVFVPSPRGPVEEYSAAFPEPPNRVIGLGSVVPCDYLR